MRSLLCLSLLLLLPACTAFWGAEAVSIGTTDKTISDHVISAASGKDCSFLRTQQGRTYCVEDEKNPSFNNLYCYRNLAGVTCYDRPAFEGNQGRVGYDGGAASVR